MVGNAGAWSVEPVTNPGLREAKRQRLIQRAIAIAEAAKAFRETLQRATLAAEALALPESR